MFLIDHPAELFFCLFLILLVALAIGFRCRAGTNDDEIHHEQIVGTRDGIVILLSLLLGFTLAMALGRYDLRKQLLVDEANAIGTTGLRAQMLPEPARTRCLGLLREYAASRLHTSDSKPGSKEFSSSLAHSAQLQNELWQQAVAVSQQNPNAITSLFVSALNETFDLSEKQLASLENRIPTAIWVMLGLIALLACLTAGYSLRVRFLMSMVVTPLMIAIVMSLIADLDSPRSGTIQVGQQSMERVLSSLKDKLVN